MPTNSKEYNREYYNKNKEKIKSRNYAWVADNPDKVKAIKQKWWNNNKDKAKLKHKEWQKTLKGYLARKLFHLKKMKRSRVLEFDIDAAYLLSLYETQKGLCAISKYVMTYPECTLFSISVDRIDPSKGYTRDNVQLVCQGINFAKNKYSNEDMIAFWNHRHSKETYDEGQTQSRESGR
mgnify:CR=1 FL=1